MNPDTRPMKNHRHFAAHTAALSLACALLGLSCDKPLAAEDSKDKPAAAQDAPKPAAGLVPLDIKLPAPAFKGTPKDIQLSSYVEPLSDKPRPPMMVPPGLKNLAPTAKLSSSVTNTSQESLAKIVDGDKEAS